VGEADHDFRAWGSCRGVFSHSVLRTGPGREGNLDRSELKINLVQKVGEPVLGYMHGTVKRSGCFLAKKVGSAEEGRD